MKTKIFFIFGIIIFSFLLLGCNKNNDDDDLLNTSTYMKATINGEKWMCDEVVADYNSDLNHILTIVAIDPKGDQGLQLQIIDYEGKKKYNIDEHITIQREYNAYVNPGGNAGSIEITYDNGGVYKGTFEFTLVNVLDSNDKLIVKDGEFKANSK